MESFQQKLQLANEHLKQLQTKDKTTWDTIKAFLTKVKHVQNENPNALMFEKLNRLLEIYIPDNLPSVSTIETPFTYNDLLTITYATLGSPQYDFNEKILTPPTESSQPASKRARYTGGAGGAGTKQKVYTGSKGGKYILVNGRRKYV